MIRAIYATIFIAFLSHKLISRLDCPTDATFSIEKICVCNNINLVYDASTNWCENCPASLISNGNECLSCGNGTLNTATTQCDCYPGFTNHLSKTCLRCYQNNPALASGDCAQCINATASIDTMSCECLEGYEKQTENSCKPCKSNYISKGGVDAKCLFCGMHTTESISECDCADGYILNIQTGSCYKCFRHPIDPVEAYDRCHTCEDSAIYNANEHSKCVCDSRSQWNFITEICESCKDSEVKIKDACVSCGEGSSFSVQSDECSCKIGTTLSDSVCVECYHSSTSQQQNPNSCYVCANSADLITGCDCIKYNRIFSREDKLCRPFKGDYLHREAGNKYRCFYNYYLNIPTYHVNSLIKCKMCSSGRSIGNGRCMCPGGYYTIGAVCHVCPLGYYKSDPTDGFDENPCSYCSSGIVSEDRKNCVSCISNSVPNPDRSFCWCLPNFMYNTVDNKCEPCGANSYNFGRLDNTCKNCPSNSIRHIGENFCKPCPDFSIASLVNDGSCKCVDGYYRHHLTVVCVPCPPGSFRNSSMNENSCTRCPSDKISGAGESSCDTVCSTANYEKRNNQFSACVCIPGYSRLLNACKPCRKGQFSQGLENACIQCFGDTYADTEASYECKRCPKYAKAIDSKIRCRCIAGYGFPDDFHGTNYANLDACIPCTPGTSSTADQDMCEPCGENRATHLHKQSDCVDCIKLPHTKANVAKTLCECVPGYGFVFGNHCQKCRPGTYSPGVYNACQVCKYNNVTRGFGSLRCVPCGNNSVAVINNYECVCKKGFMKLGEECIKCYPGHVSKGHLRKNTTCTVCPSRHIADKTQSQCLKCIDFTIPNRMRTKCVCPIGYMPINIENFNLELTHRRFMGCEPCPPGKSSIGGDAKCVSCTGNEISNSYRACTECPEKRHPNSNRSECICDAGLGIDGKKCIKCVPGTYSGRDMNTCEQCPDGSVAPLGSALCKICSGIYVVNYLNSKCVCVGGFGLNIRGECVKCTKGTASRGYGRNCTRCDSTSIAPKDGTMICSDCEPNEVANDERTKCILIYVIR